MFLFVGVLHKIFIHKCAPDAVIWAEQQLVVIPGWLLQYQNAKLVQEGQLTSIKRPRLLITKKKQSKTKNYYSEERGNKMATQTIFSSPILSGHFAARARGFSEKPAYLWKKWRIWEKSGRFEASSQVSSLGGHWRIIPKSTDFIIILKLMIFRRNFFNQKAA